MIPQETQSRIRTQLSNSLFGGFKLKAIKDRTIETQKPRHARSPETFKQQNEVEFGSKEDIDGVSEAEKRSDEQLKQAQIAQQIMSVVIDFSREVDFEDRYTLCDTIGQGAHAIVKRAINDKGVIVAVKICRSGDPEIIKTFIESYKICKIFNDSHILKCHEIFIDEQTETLRLVMEYCSYPSLQSYLRKSQTLTLYQVKKLLKTLLETINHIHERGVCHRDLKPDNILVDIQSMSIKLIDFGVSSRFKRCQIRRGQLLIQQKDMWTRTGNYLYCAPEIFEGVSYTEQIDMWACGIIMFQCLFGKLPFYEDTICNTIEAIREAHFELPDNVDKLCKDLLQRMLNPDPILRVSAQDALNHPFFYEMKTKLTGGQLSFKEIIEIKDEEGSKVTVFDRHRHTRSNTHYNGNNYRRSLELIEGSPLEGTNPLIRLSKIQQNIKNQIHIKKRTQQAFGANFLESPLIKKLRNCQSFEDDDERDLIQEVCQ